MGMLAGVMIAMAAPARADTPPMLASVTIVGDASVGATLQAVVEATGEPAPTITYAWARCEVDRPSRCHTIPEATAGSYMPVEADLGFPLIVRVTATNSLGASRRSPTRLFRWSDRHPNPRRSPRRRLSRYRRSSRRRRRRPSGAVPHARPGAGDRADAVRRARAHRPGLRAAHGPALPAALPGRARARVDRSPRLDRDAAAGDRAAQVRRYVRCSGGRCPVRRLARGRAVFASSNGSCPHAPASRSGSGGRVTSGSTYGRPSRRRAAGPPRCVRGPRQLAARRLPAGMTRPHAGSLGRAARRLRARSAHDRGAAQPNDRPVSAPALRAPALSCPRSPPRGWRRCRTCPPPWPRPVQPRPPHVLARSPAPRAP